MACSLSQWLKVDLLKCEAPNTERLRVTVSNFTDPQPISITSKLHLLLDSTDSTYNCTQSQRFNAPHFIASNGDQNCLLCIEQCRHFELVQHTRDAGGSDPTDGQL